jgi:hypothetical protein
MIFGFAGDFVLRTQFMNITAQHMSTADARKIEFIRERICFFFTSSLLKSLEDIFFPPLSG